jgi:hypothetical protein
MSVATENSAGAAAIRPFKFEAPEAELQALRARISATRFPDKETVEGQSQGTQLATIQALARYWATEHDWRKCEAKLNALPQFITEIDGLRSPAKAVRLGLNAGPRGEVVGDGAGVAGHGGRGGVYLVG